jgi:hypothetical protein
VWVQTTPIGEALIVYWETDDPQRTLRSIADSQDELDKEFRQIIKAAAPAINFGQEQPLANELLYSWERS